MSTETYTQSRARFNHAHQSAQQALSEFPHYTSNPSIHLDFREMELALTSAARALEIGRESETVFLEQGAEAEFTDLMRRARRDYDLLYSRFNMYIKSMRAAHVAGTERWMT